MKAPTQFLILLTLACPPVFSQDQDIYPIIPEVRENSVVQVGRLSDLPISSNSTLVKKSSGYNAPEWMAVQSLYSGEARFHNQIPRRDYILLAAAATKAVEIQKMQNGMNEFCLRILMADDATTTMADAVSAAEILERTEQIMQEEILSSYDQLLSNLSVEAANIVDEWKNYLHSTISAVEINWLAESERDPLGFLEGHAGGCRSR
jgi:hypothetical protein